MVIAHERGFPRSGRRLSRAAAPGAGRKAKAGICWLAAAVVGLSAAGRAGTQEAGPKPETVRRFRALDADGDGVLSARELGSPARLLVLDTDGDGLVRLPEWRDHVEGMAASAAPAVPRAPATREELDVSYARAPGADPAKLSLDLFAPARARSAPVMVFVHGGWWAEGDKRDVRRAAPTVVAEGWVFVSINYRLVPTVKPVEQAADVAAALAWVRANVARYGGDPERLCVAGYSAGAHLAALALLDPRHLEAAGVPRAAIRAMALLDSSAFDVPALMARNGGARGEHVRAFGRDPRGWREASPVAYVRTDRPAPPALVALAETSGPYVRSCEALVTALRRAGHHADLLDVSALRNHGTLIREFGKPWDPVTAEVIAFAEACAGRSPPAPPGGRRALRSESSGVPPALQIRVTAILEAADADLDGRVAREEARGALRAAFSELDANRDGHVTRLELARGLAASIERAGQ